MSAAVTVAAVAFTDYRYDVLAKEARLSDADHARGKMLLIWAQCTIRCSDVLARQFVDHVFGPGGAESLVRSELAEIIEDGVRIKGAKGRVEWLSRNRENGRHGSMGGRPRTQVVNPGGLSKQNPGGKPQSKAKQSKAIQRIEATAPSPSVSTPPASLVGSDVSLSLPLVGKNEQAVTTADIAEWSEAYPGVDVEQELRHMRQWLLANPTRRKTEKGVRSFVVSWLGRSQDRGGSRATSSQLSRKGQDIQKALTGLPIDAFVFDQKAGQP